MTNDQILKKHQVKTADKRLRDKPSLGLGLGLELGLGLGLGLGLVPRALGLGLGLESIQELLLQPSRVT